MHLALGTKSHVSKPSTAKQAATVNVVRRNGTESLMETFPVNRCEAFPLSYLVFGTLLAIQTTTILQLHCTTPKHEGNQGE